MDQHLFTQWVQAQIPEPAQQPQQQHAVGPHDVSVGHDWAKDRSQTAATALGVHSPTMANQTLDLNEFASTMDSHSGSNTSSLASLYPYGSQSYFLATSPFNALSYPAQWSTPTHLPLSSYSSLNGATTSSSAASTSQSQPQAQHSPPLQHQPNPQQQPGQLMIDPALTLNGNVQPYSQSPIYPSQQTQQPQQQSQQSAQQQQQQRTYSFNSPLMYTSNPYYRPQTQQAPQGTMSPQALHSPMMPMMQTFYAHPNQPQAQTLSQPQLQAHGMSISPVASTSQQTVSPAASSASTPAPVAGPTPEEKEERKRKFLAVVRPLLQPSAFTGAGAVQHLTDRIADYGVTEVDAPTRLEILAQVRDGAGNHYYRAWSENPLAIDITREWIKAAAKDDSGVLKETIMPLLHLIDRLPFTVDTLKASRIGKIVVYLEKNTPVPAIKDMASNLERRWRAQLNGTGDNGNEAATKKRKAPESTAAATAKATGPQKKAALGTATSTKPAPVKKEVKPVTAASVKDAKADSSFFSAPKPKQKLPSFKKAPPVPLSTKKEDAVAQPSNFDPFKEALKSMKVARKESPAVSTPPPQSASSTASVADSLNQTSLNARNLKKKKSVSWAPEGQLEAIKLIDKAIYDDDPVDGIHMAHSLRDLDRGEGAALHAHLFEETIDWSEPSLIEMPPDPESNQPRMSRGHASEEKRTQEEREQTALSAVYMTPSQIPDSPAEPSSVLTEEETDKNVTHMLLGEEIDAMFYGADDQMMGLDPNVNVTQLVGQLASALGSNNGMAMDSLPVPATSGEAPALDLSALQSLPQEQIQQLLQQLAANVPAVAGQYGAYGGAAGGASVSGASDAAGWGSGAFDYGQQQQEQGSYHDESGKVSSRWEDGRGGRGRGGRGRGRGRGEDWGGKPYNHKKKPCTFFLQQRCKYGDQCDFLHEYPSGERMD